MFLAAQPIFDRQRERYPKIELCRNCVRWVRNWRRTPTFTASHGEAFQGGKSFN